MSTLNSLWALCGRIRTIRLVLKYVFAGISLDSIFHLVLNRMDIFIDWVPQTFASSPVSHLHLSLLVQGLGRVVILHSVLERSIGLISLQQSVFLILDISLIGRIGNTEHLSTNITLLQVVGVNHHLADHLPGETDLSFVYQRRGLILGILLKVFTVYAILLSLWIVWFSQNRIQPLGRRKFAWKPRTVLPCWVCIRFWLHLYEQWSLV